MPTPDQITNFNRMRSGQSTLAIAKPVPKPNIKGRVPTTEEINDWYRRLEVWRVELNQKLGGGAA